MKNISDATSWHLFQKVLFTLSIVLHGFEISYDNGYLEITLWSIAKKFG